MTTALQKAADTLVNALRECEEYQEYQALKKLVMGDETNRALLKEYQRAQTSLQMAAMAGKEPDGETVQRFSSLSSLLYMNEEASRYLLAQMRLQKLTAEVLQQLTQAAGIEMELPGM